MKKLVAFVSFVLLVSVTAFAGDKRSQNDEMNNALVGAKVMLQGSVKDQATGEELTGVKVAIVGTDKVAYSDFDGNFKFKNLKPGKYQLELSLISYEKMVTVDYLLKSKNGQNVNVSLKNLVN